MSERHDILVIAEPTALAFELLALGRELATATGGSVCALSLAADPATLIAHGADRVFAAPDSKGRYGSEVALAAIDAALLHMAPRLIVAGHSSLGAELAPRLAFRLEAGIATACERVTVSDGTVRATRPCFGNKAREVLALVSEPAVVTVKARVYDALPSDASRRGEVVELAANDEARFVTRVLARTQDDAAGSAQLETAKAVVAGGRGLGGPEGFAVLEKLASALGGAVGASRVACDLGWCPHSWQIGLTGRTVTPDLYVAVGISGASHHMAGCGNSKTIVAINSDPEAAIFREARFGVVGDYSEIVPALAAEIERRRGTA